MIIILTLNCFKNTVAIYSVQEEILLLKADSDNKLLSIDHNSCQLFNNLQTQVKVRIGDLTFESQFQIYSPDKYSYKLTLTEGSLVDISKFSVAVFTLKTMDNQIAQQGTINEFKIQVFNHSSCFSATNLLYNQSTSKILVHKTAQKTCIFTADGTVKSQVWYRDGVVLTQIMETNVGKTYVDWFKANETCSDVKCLSYMEKFVTTLFPEADYVVAIQQKFKKKIKQYDESGIIREVEADFDQDLILRQQFDQLGSEYQIPSVSEIELRPLYQSIQITQKVDEKIKFEFTAPYDLFMITVCISSNGLSNGKYHCFTQNSTEVHLEMFNIIVCEDNAEMTIEECLGKLFAISNYPDSIKGYVYYETLLNGLTQESYTYGTELKRNQYSKMTLRIQKSQICVQFSLKDGYIQIPRLQTIQLQWETNGNQYFLDDTFLLPSLLGSYCIQIDQKIFQKIMNPTSKDFKISIDKESYYINSILYFLRLGSFKYGFATFVCLFTINLLILGFYFRISQKKKQANVIIKNKV